MVKICCANRQDSINVPGGLFRPAVLPFIITRTLPGYIYRVNRLLTDVQISLVSRTDFQRPAHCSVEELEFLRGGPER